MNSVVELELNATMDASLEYFFASLKGGKDSSSLFLRHWTSLNDTLQSHREHLKAETIANAHNLASTIGNIAYRMLQLEAHKDRLHEELAKELSYVLNDSMENLVIRDELPILSDSSPPYIKPCCQWLLTNLHNPYPPKSVRNSICRQTGSLIKDLDAWFTDARKRIGWNHLRRTHFSNKREKIIDAATSFFKPSREFLKLNPSQFTQRGELDDYSMAFVEMEERAQRMFCDKFEETPLAKTLEQPVQDVPLLAEIQNRAHKTESQNEQTYSTLKSMRVGHTYPSPECSPGRTPELTLEPLSPTLVTISSAANSNASLKRRRSSSDSYMDDIGPDRSDKRHKSNYSQNSDSALAAASLPSPAASLNEVFSPPGNDSLLLSSATPPTLPAPIPILAHVQSISSTKRKRCFSDSEDQRPSKYPQPAPLSRITSNPLPTPHDFLFKSSIGDLFQDCLLTESLSHDISPPNCHEILDASTPVDVSYYQYSLSPIILDNGLRPEFTLHEFSLSALDSHQETFELSSSSELNTWIGGLQEHNLQDYLNHNAENSTFDVELDPLLSEPNYFQFSEVPTLDELSIATSSTFDWTAFAGQLSNAHPTSAVETGAVLSIPSPVSAPACQSTMMERAAKRERAKLLRAELKRLEADIV